MRFSNIISSKRTLRLTFATLALSIVASANAGWTVVKLHPNLGINSHVNGIFGQQQAGMSTLGNTPHAGVWSGSASSWTDLHPAGASSSTLTVTNGVWQGGNARVVVGNTTYDHASLWNGTAASWLDLSPAGSLDSSVSGLDGSQQVGVARFGFDYHAGYWTGSAASWVDLHPAGATFSSAIDAHGGQQVGYARIGGVDHAALWTGTAASFVDLSPNGVRSYATAVYNGQQAGYIYDGDKQRAVLWSGTAASMVDLNPPGYHGSEILAMHGNVQVGWVYGLTVFRTAALWRGTAASFEDIGVWLPSDIHSGMPSSVWSSETVTYVGGTAKYPPPGGALQQGIMWVSNDPGTTTSITIPQGILVSGGLAEVLQSDDAYFAAKPNYNVPRNTAPLQIEAVGISPTSSASILKFRLEGGSDLSGGTQVISLYNYTTNVFDALDTRTISSAGYKVDVVVTQNAGRYVHPTTKQLRARIEVTPPLNAARSWAFLIDEATWGITQP